MEDRLETLLSTPPSTLPPDQVVADLDLLVPLIAQAEAALRDHVRELEARGVTGRDGALSTAAWLRDRYRIGLPTARRYIRLAAPRDTA